ncbi:MAG TPA: hypothetical protein VL068_07165 [Microthrixaceae bacterium]|nr:hypothetical protein [Microthrixaceae bacterium]
MNTRRSLSLLAIVASLALFAGACSSSDDTASKKDKTETTAKDTKSDSKSDSKDDGKDAPTDTEADAQPKKLSDEEFTAALKKVNDSIKDAGSDVCKLAKAQNTEPPEPTNPAQVEEMVGTYVILLRSMAGALPSGSAANIKALNEAASQIEQSGKDSKYSADFFSSEGIMKIMTSEGVTAGITEFSTAAQKCPGASGGADGSTPEG